MDYKCFSWFGIKFENEYNHSYPQVLDYLVWILKLPDGIEEEWEEDYKDHHPANGHIQLHTMQLQVIPAIL